MVRSKKDVIKSIEQLSGIKNVDFSEMSISNLEKLERKFKAPGGLILDVGLRKAENFVEDKIDKTMKIAAKVKKDVRENHPIISAAADFLSDERKKKKKSD